jgi:hypothetical protein
VLGGVEVFGGVPVPGVVATTYMPADHAEAEMHPGIAYFEAVFAPFCARGDLIDFFEVFAGFVHLYAPPDECGSFMGIG